jgi:signal peptidase I
VVEAQSVITPRPAWRLPAAAAALGALSLLSAVVLWPGAYDARYRMSGTSMEPTIAAGERVQARTGTDDVRRGDIVVFDHAWPDGGGLLIKRVIAVSGDTVACCDPDGRLQVNGTSIDEDYLKAGTGNTGVAHIEFSATVPPGRVFVAGDDRANSRDSRLYTTVPDQASVPVTAIKGIVVRTAKGPVRPTAAFVNAGLAAAPAEAESNRTWLIMLWLGAGLLALGVGWFLLNLTTSARRRRKPAGV